MATKIRPLHDRVIVKRIKEEEKTKGGLIIRKKNRRRQVINLDVKAGDKVLFGKYSGTEIKLDGEEHLILREDDLGVVE